MGIITLLSDYYVCTHLCQFVCAFCIKFLHVTCLTVLPVMKPTPAWQVSWLPSSRSWSQLVSSVHQNLNHTSMFFLNRRTFPLPTPLNCICSVLFFFLNFIVITRWQQIKQKKRKGKKNIVLIRGLQTVCTHVWHNNNTTKKTCMCMYSHSHMIVLF